MKFNSVASLLCLANAAAFSPPLFGASSRSSFSASSVSTSSSLAAAAQGFDKSSSSNSNDENKTSGKSYGAGGTSGTAPIRDMIDSQAAMDNFFSARAEWLPLFKSIAAVNDDNDDDNDACQAVTYLEKVEIEIDFHEESEPWRRLEPIPKDEQDRQALAHFLDSMQESLLSIPVDEYTEEDEDDMEFVEEGRRMLAVSRFHVIRDNQGGSVESVDALFEVCWNELKELHSTAEAHTGSLIVLPEYELTDLRRFADMNLLRPLEWLGIHADFEIASMKRGSPAIRLLYKLNDMPTGAYTAEKGFGAVEDAEDAVVEDEE